MAALRIAVALALLLPISSSDCLPYFTSHGLEVTFPGGSVKGITIGRSCDGFRVLFSVCWCPRSGSPPAIALLIGYRVFITGLIAWACAVSFWNINPWMTNGGDQMRNFLLLLVACSRSGAVWGVQSVRRGNVCSGPVFVPGWPWKLLWVYLCCMYFFSGLYKLQSPA